MGVEAARIVLKSTDARAADIDTLLFATADPAGMEWGRSILGGLIILAWVAGIAYGVAREARRATRPVS
jgi:3-oxoacyl-[acyl-carrier-protein] synthase III